MERGSFGEEGPGALAFLGYAPGILPGERHRLAECVLIDRFEDHLRVTLFTRTLLDDPRLNRLSADVY